MNFDNLNGVDLRRVLVGKAGGKRPLEKKKTTVLCKYRPQTTS